MESVRAEGQSKAAITKYGINSNLLKMERGKPTGSMYLVGLKFPAKHGQAALCFEPSKQGLVKASAVQLQLRKLSLRLSQMCEQGILLDELIILPAARVL